MKIAWRYQNLKVVSSSPSGSQHFGHFFDLTTTIDEKILNKANVNFYSSPESKFKICYGNP